MKICKFVEGSFIPALDGASQRFSLIAKNLTEIGVEVFIIHCYRGWSNLKQISQQSFKTYALSPKYYYNDYSIVEKIITEIDPDIIEMNDLELILSTGVHLNKKFNIPLIFDAQFISSELIKSFTKNRKSVEDIEKQEADLGKVASGVICFTEIDKQNLLKTAHIKPERIKIIPIGSDFNSLRMKSPNQKNKYVLFIGNMFFQPNQEAVEFTINQIVPLVLQKHPDLIFKFVGDVPISLKQKYQDSQIIFTGRVSDINKAFEGARICIAPIQTGGGMRVKILTYLASGIPIVSTTIGAAGISDLSVLRIGDTAQEFSNQILELANDLQESIKLGKKANELAREKYSWLDISQQCLKLYNYAIANPVYSRISPLAGREEPFWLTETIQKGRFEVAKNDPEKLYLLGNSRIQSIDVYNGSIF